MLITARPAGACKARRCHLRLLFELRSLAQALQCGRSPALYVRDNAASIRRSLPGEILSRSPDCDLVEGSLAVTLFEE